MSTGTIPWEVPYEVPDSFLAANVTTIQTISINGTKSKDLFFVF